jgi:hypothetical protein
MRLRRTPFVLTATAAGLAGVLSYHAHATSFGSFNPADAARPTPPRRSQTGHAQSVSGGGVTRVPTPLVSRQGTGPLITYGYGELAVQVSVSGGKITAVDVTGLRTAEQYSQSLAQQVVPMLRSEVLQAQNANINLVSGATYTSQAFAMSLQSALKRLGV